MSNLKDKQFCGGDHARCKNADCPLFGTLGVPARDGTRRIKGCGDPVARGKRNRRSGLSKQRDARKRLGVAPSNRFGDANEENWQDGVFANEVKSGKQVQPAVTIWNRIEEQILRNQSHFGSLRKPARAILMPEGWGKEGLVMMKLSTWEETVLPAMQEYYGE